MSQSHIIELAKRGEVLGKKTENPRENINYAYLNNYILIY
jgi:hypothetical protein